MLRIRFEFTNSIFIRLLITFLIILIPLFLLCALMYHWFISTVKNEISDSAKNQVQFYIDSLEKDIRHIKVLQYDMMNDENLNKLATITEAMNDADKTQTIRMVQQRLVSIMDSSVYIKKISVHVPALDRTIYPQSISNLKEDRVKSLLSIQSDSDSQIIYYQGTPYLIVTYPFMFNSKEYNQLFVIEIELSTEEFKNDLLQFINVANSGDLLINNQKNYFVSCGISDGVNSLLQRMAQDKHGKNDDDSFSFINNKKLYYTIRIRSEYLGISMYKFILEKQVFEQADKYKIWLWVFSIVSLCILVLLISATNILLHKPIIILIKSFQKIENNEFDIKIEHKHNDEFKYLYARFNSMVEKIRFLIEKVYKQELLMRQAELKKLQAQINPHFLYNSFFILHKRIKREEYDSALVFSEQMGEYYRYITRNASSEVSLIREVEHARIYAEIQAARFSNRIKVEFEQLPLELHNLTVPRLILQPIIENSFEHGLEDKEEGGLLKVRFAKNGHTFSIQIDDNGEQLSDIDLASIKESLERDVDGFETTGIVNIHHRIKLMFGGNSGISVSRSEFGGLKISVDILLSEENYDV